MKKINIVLLLLTIVFLSGCKSDGDFEFKDFENKYISPTSYVITYGETVTTTDSVTTVNEIGFFYYDNGSELMLLNDIYYTFNEDNTTTSYWYSNSESDYIGYTYVSSFQHTLPSIDYFDQYLDGKTYTDELSPYPLSYSDDYVTIILVNKNYDDLEYIIYLAENDLWYHISLANSFELVEQPFEDVGYLDYILDELELDYDLTYDFTAAHGLVDEWYITLNFRNNSSYIYVDDYLIIYDFHSGTVEVSYYESLVPIVSVSDIYSSVLESYIDYEILENIGFILAKNVELSR